MRLLIVNLWDFSLYCTFQKLHFWLGTRNLHTLMHMIELFMNQIFVIVTSSDKSPCFGYDLVRQMMFEYQVLTQYINVSYAYLNLLNNLKVMLFVSVLCYLITIWSITRISVLQETFSFCSYFYPILLCKHVFYLLQVNLINWFTIIPSESQRGFLLLSVLYWHKRVSVLL